MSDSLTKNSAFLRLLGKLVATHSGLQQQAARSVDTALVARNWLFGWYVVEFEQGAAARSVQYGKQLIACLSEGLAQQGLRGVSATNLKQCRAFYPACPEIGQTPSGESARIPNTQALEAGQ